MKYEVLKDQTITILQENGFDINEDIAVLAIQQKTGEVVINGQRQIQTRNVEIKFECLGEGSINEESIIGYSIYIDNNYMVDEWVSDVNQFIHILKSIGLNIN